MQRARLVCRRTFDSIADAIQREKAIKRFCRARKVGITSKRSAIAASREATSGWMSPSISEKLHRSAD